MASGLTATGETLAVNALTTGTPYVALYTSTAGSPPTTEVSGGSYARQAVTWTNAGSLPTVAQNNAVINFPTATAAWGTINQLAIMDAATAGNMRGWADVTNPKAINNGDQARFAINALQISVL